LILISLYIVGQVLAVLLSPRWSGLELAEFHMGFKVSAVALGQTYSHQQRKAIVSFVLFVRLSIRMEQVVFFWTIFNET
jgi:triacylglycerol esterase/lipase EstA (alpha/beta hydrolase family)